MMAAALTLRQMRCEDRELYLFDTFTGMTPPTARDYTIRGQSARLIYEGWGPPPNGSEGSGWCYASLEEVRHSLYRTGYPPERIHFIGGRVEETLPEQAPETVAMLRLDTDWYESTRHELTHLFPRLARGGVFIIDDYGIWMGARKAMDEYLRDNHVALLLQRIDYTGRIGIKV
jgi:hypothetical protein